MFVYVWKSTAVQVRQFKTPEARLRRWNAANA